MAEIKQIKVGGTIYDVADGALRDAMLEGLPNIVVSITASPTSVECGTSKEVTYTASATYNGSVVKSGITFTIDGQAATANADGKATYKKSISSSETGTHGGTVSVTAVGTYKSTYAGIPFERTASKAVSVTFLKRSYFGMLSGTTITTADLATFITNDGTTAKTLLASANTLKSTTSSYSVNTGANGGYLWFCFPEEITITSVTGADGNVWECANAVQITDSKGSTYNCLRLNKQQSANQTLTFKFK